MALAASVVSTLVGLCVLWAADDVIVSERLANADRDGVGELDPADVRPLDATIENNPFCPSCSQSGRELGSGLEAISRLPLELLGTMESTDPRFSLATIRDAGHETVGAYGVHDRVRPGVTVESVGRGRVVVRNGSRLEVIELGVAARADAAEPEPAPSPETRRPHVIEGATDAIACERQQCTVERAFVDRLLANPGLLKGQGRVVPAIQGGETQGYKLYGIRPGSLPKLLGLKNGDLITQVNGTELDSLDAVMELYGKLRNASHLSVTILRKGKAVHKEVEIR